jgi:hypothetical protein
LFARGGEESLCNIFYFFGGNFFYATAFKSWVGVISDIVGFSPNANRVLAKAEWLMGNSIHDINVVATQENQLRKKYFEDYIYSLE